MNPEQIRLPGFAAIQSALRQITESLARELAEPSAVAPAWSPFEWGVARAVAALQGISGMLATRLRWREPREFIGFLHEQHAEIAAFQQRIRRLLARLDAAATEAGVPYIALKGSALLELELHAPGERPMGDVDLLVLPAAQRAMAGIIAGCGYELGLDKRRHQVFFPVPHGAARGYAEHRDNPLYVELHNFIAEPLPHHEVDITTSLWPAAPRAGANAYASLAALMRHGLLHAAGNMRAHALRHMQLLDTAALAHRMRAQDWQELLDPGHGADWWMFPVLILCERYSPGAIPPGVLAHTAAHCPRWLRARARRYSLHEVSWSNLRIAAFPGYEWSRSPREALHFAWGRVFPSDHAIGELQVAVTAQPALSHVPWYQIPHARRVLRWALSRPPRVQTLYSVRAALGGTFSAQ